MLRFPAAPILAAFAACCVLSPVPESLGEERVREAIVVDIDVKDKPLFAVVQYIRDLTGENIVLGTDQAGRPLVESRDLRVTVHIERRPWKEALRRVCESAGVFLDVVDGEVWRVHVPPLVTLDLTDSSPGIMIETIARCAGKNILIDRDVWSLPPLSMTVKRRPWNEVLRSMPELSPVRLFSDRQQEVLYAASAWKDVKGDFWRPWPPAKKPGPSKEGPRIDIDVKEKPLYRVVEYIAGVSDHAVMFRPREDGTPDERLREAPVTLKLEQVHWATAIRFAVRSAEGRVAWREDGSCQVYRPTAFHFAVSEADLRDVLLGIAKTAGFDLKLGSDVASHVGIEARLSGIGPEKALRAVAAANGWSAVREGPGRYKIAGALQDSPAENRSRLEDVIRSWEEDLESLQRRLREEKDARQSFRLWRALYGKVTREHKAEGSFKSRREKLLAVLEELRPEVEEAFEDLVLARLRLLEKRLIALESSGEAHKALHSFLAEMERMGWCRDLAPRPCVLRGLLPVLDRVAALLRDLVEKEKTYDVAVSMIDRISFSLSSLREAPGNEAIGTFFEEMNVAREKANRILAFHELGIRVDGVFRSPDGGTVILNGHLFREGETFQLEDLGLSGPFPQEELRVAKMTRTDRVRIEYRGILVECGLGMRHR